MAVSYKKLFKMLIDRDMKKKELCELAEISSATMSKLSKGDNVTMEVIEKICTKMNCSVDEILEIIPEHSEKETGKNIN